jgi:hypothetical protein
LNLRGVKDVRITSVPTTNSQVPEPRAFEVETDIGKIKKIRITRYWSNPSGTE